MVNVEIKVRLTNDPKTNRIILDNLLSIIKEYENRTELTLVVRDIPLSKAFAGIKPQAGD